MSLSRLIRIRNYRMILFSNIINRLGDSIDSLVFAWVVYSLTNSAGWSAIIFAFNQGTSIFFQPLVGPIVDKKSPKRIMIVSDLARGSLVLCTLIMLIFDMVQPGYLIVVTILVSVAEAFHMPASVSILQSSMTDDIIDSGMSYNVSLTKIAVLIGTAIGGLLISSISSEFVLFIDIITFIVSILLIVNVNEKTKMVNPDSGYLFALKTGFVYLLSSKALIILCIECILINIAVVPFDALLAPIASEIYNGDASVISLLSVTVTLGTIVGAYIYNKIAPHKKSLLIVNICGISLGIYYLDLVVIPYYFSGSIQIVILGVVSVIMGVLLGLMITYVQTEFIKRISKEYIGRISAIRYSITYSLAPITAFLISFISSKVDIYIIILGASIITITVFLLMLITYTCHLKKYFDRVVVER